MKKVKLYDMTDLYMEYADRKEDDPTYEFPTLSYTDEDENEVFVAGGSSMIHYLAEHYPDFFYYDFGARLMGRVETPYEVDYAYNNLVGTWEHFVSMHPEYVRMAQMLNRTDYDPLENYDRKEDGGWKDTTDDDAIHKMKYAKQTTTTTNDPKLKTKTTGNVWADGSTVAIPDTESITEPVRANVDDVDTVKTENNEHTDESSVEGNLTVTREFQNYHVHGNIGVTTAAQMIAGEGDVRSKYVLEPMIYDAFVREHFTLTGEVRV